MCYDFEGCTYIDRIMQIIKYRKHKCNNDKCNNDSLLKILCSKSPVKSLSRVTCKIN